ncbi:hypothetical protein NOMA109596_05460 [Nocardioides marinus]|uniref:Uncharacterized protein n=1 Tax=Nocardioides marinus TaxID=374514 RepID=A0A7Y9YJF9_9ACTN|nr:hypothetical protein [Nocardioides marinus]NYI12139.1 hypothetical protein [Nocardioides marinus]
MGGLFGVDWDIEVAIERHSASALAWDRESARLTYRDSDGVVAFLDISEADLRTWLQILLLSSFAPATREPSHERAIREMAGKCRHHASVGEDPFTGLRERRASSTARPSLAG